jgi:hypothetical protein
MSILTRIAKTLLANNTQDQAYATVVYPTRGQAVIVHDGLGIQQERPWYEAAQEEAQEAAPAETRREAKQTSQRSVKSRTAPVKAARRNSAEEQDDFDLGVLPQPGRLKTGFSLFGSSELIDASMTDYNPASGMAMLGGGLDAGGNAFGTY